MFVMKEYLNCLVVGHTDGHGAVATAISIKNLQKECENVDYIAKFPDTGVIPKFWKETISDIKEKAKNYDKIVIVDIPLDKFNLEESARKLSEICSITETHYVDHHEMPEEIKEFLEKYGCKVTVRKSAYDTVYGKPDLKWNLVGAISDRDPTIRHKVTEELQELADGLDVLVRKDLSKAIDAIIKNKESVFKEEAKRVPDPHDMEVHGSVVVVKDEIPETWIYKVLDKACRKTGADYAIYLSENRRDRTTGELRDYVSVVKYWLSDKPSVKSKLSEELQSEAFGHPDAQTIVVEPGRGKEVARKLLDELR